MMQGPFRAMIVVLALLVFVVSMFFWLVTP